MQVEHKIQSRAGPLSLQLAQVPKMLSLFRCEWAPSAFIVSFKLETDTDILLTKARAALQKYHVHAVVANELHTRKTKVVVVMADSEREVRKEKPDSCVEKPLVEYLVEHHLSYINGGGDHNVIFASDDGRTRAMDTAAIIPLVRPGHDIFSVSAPNSVRAEGVTPADDSS
ncbi:hypothetical protein CBR_g9001 [Chara braunii]|uniref:DNA/pantothenate metabolism flavoprotein C-terminal domain-containing protein n=1 Tax=Chara braunii TaxID=69332 RepID=A0A388KNH6_CHABU|nr:hypothetical protein CBR_g9001 [Chara braunii]|eukprot:GBG71585.1 hypothetical protein CBR_g9001 [Chara braunii]